LNIYIVRAKWGDTDLSEKFVNGGYWENGYGEDKYSKTLNKITPGSILVLARPGKIIFSIGRCTINDMNYSSVQVKWFPGFVPIEINVVGRHIRTINKVTDINFFKKIEDELESQNTGIKDFINDEEIINIEEVVEKQLRIKEFSIENFKFYLNKKTFKLEGKNLLVYGENGSGKSSLVEAIKAISLASIGEIRNLDHYKNIYAENEISVEISFTDGRTYSISGTDINTDSLHGPLNDIGYIHPFLTYKDVLQIYFKDIVQGKSRNLYDFFRTLLKNHKVDGDKRLEELEGDNYFNKLIELVHDLKTLANNFLEEYNEEIVIQEFHSSSFDRSITIDLTYGSNFDTIENYQDFLNEAKLTSLGLSILFAAILKKEEINSSKCKLLVLDDLLISLDMSHRHTIHKIITDNIFESYQKIILTHERGFFNLLKDRLKKDDWEILEIYEKKDKGFSEPYIIPSLDFLEKAQEALVLKKYDSSANFLRKSIEKIAEDFTGKPRTKNGKPKKLQDLFNDIKGKIESSSNYSEQFKSEMITIISEIIHFRDSILNPFSHADRDTPLFGRELEEAYVLIKGFDDAIKKTLK
jgi:energy-coupling factor transporter ATP-binding protein EcfA2